MILQCGGRSGNYGKKKIGKILYYFSLGMFFAPIPLWLIREKITYTSTEDGLTRITLLVLSGGFFMYAISSLLKDTLGMGGRLVEKTKQPDLFWSFIVFDFFMGFFCFVASFFYGD